MNKSTLLLLFSVFLLCISCYRCTSRSGSNNKSQEEKKIIHTSINTEVSTKRLKPSINIYLENSGSMFGYVGSGGEFINVVAQIAGDCDLEAKETSYFLINGAETKLGSSLRKFTNTLSVKGMRIGDPSTSDLNKIFNMALNHAGKGNISILISDGIYSVNGSPCQLLAKLKTQSILTRNNFIKRLKDENLVTQLIKLKSSFAGYYYPASGGQIKINQKRPYYIWVIGEKEDIQNVFDFNYFGNLPGFVNEVKYIKLDNNKPECGLLRHKVKGNYTYKFGLELNDVKPRNLETSFSVGFEFADIPLPSSYFDQLDVYENELGYKAISVTHFDDLSPSERASAQKNIKNHCTHIVTFEKHNAPWGLMNLKIKNLKPIWIDKTHDNDDSDIKGDVDRTFGFKYLIKGMDDAYRKVNKSENITEYKIKINK